MARSTVSLTVNQFRTRYQTGTLTRALDRWAFTASRLCNFGSAAAAFRRPKLVAFSTRGGFGRQTIVPRWQTDSQETGGCRGRAERSRGLARCRPQSGSKLRGEAMIDNRTQVFDVAMKNARTIEACVDRLAMIGADHELKLVAQRLSRLTFRAV